MCRKEIEIAKQFKSWSSCQVRLIEDEDFLLGRTLQILMEKAREDDVISDEEVEIMKQLNIDIPQYVAMLKEAKADGIIDLQEQMKLEEFKHEIIQKASDIALSDYKLSDGEKGLLIKLTDIINNYFPPP